MKQHPSDGTRTRHIGAYLRETVIPDGMSVTKAAKLLGVGRPALSNLLNGNASLSAEMAQKLERAFATNAEDLLKRQASFEAADSTVQGEAQKSKVFVPAFLNFTSRDIEDWGKGRIDSRSRLPVLLRRLVNSTVSSISLIDFPAYDDSQRSGWDGFTEVELGNPWVPRGKTGWEFGTNEEPKPKADRDYTKSLKLPAKERKQITFIFVTTMRWSGKKVWADQRRSEGKWKDVRAYDVSDLEQWLEQSIATQVWFATETKVQSRGAMPLHACWTRWSADCNPPLVPSLFSEALKNNIAEKIHSKLQSNETVIVTADSREEGLAFIHAAVGANDSMAELRDRIVFFSEPGTLTALIARNVGVIPIVASPEIERELAPHKGNVSSIVVQPKNISSIDADVALDTLSFDAFNSALTDMGLERDEIDRLSHESGRSLTVLRRRLSHTEAIRTPPWSTDTRSARYLVPIALAGSWDSRSKTDKDVLSMVGARDDYEGVERGLLELLALEDSPVWSVGSYRGVVSKIDALFAIRTQLTTADLERFLEVAELVLSEDDPALDLPDDERWMANIKGKKREISGPLREGISETLVLLAVYGRELFGDRLGFDPSVRVSLIIRRLLTPLSGRKLEAHSHDLPMYAEAAPDELLNLLEVDLEKADPATFELVRPAGSGLWSSNPRTGLLWALENIAWSPEHLVRVISVLAKLSEKKLEDNWVNKPINSLGSLFRSWFPQTRAPIDARIAGLEYLVDRYPDIAWGICVSQFEPGNSFASHNHKPRWRPDARGAGDGVSGKDRFDMQRKALDLALQWSGHTEETLGDLVRCVETLPDDDQDTVWSLVHEWAKSASEDAKAKLRETVRRHTMTKRARRRRRSNGEPKQTPASLKAAKNAYEALRPADVVQEHSWLFLSNWVEWSADELDDDEAIGEGREQRITEARKGAVKEVFDSEGFDGLIRLASVGEGGYQVGWATAQVLQEVSNRVGLILAVFDKTKDFQDAPERSLIAGLLAGASDNGEHIAILEGVSQATDASKLKQVCLIAPFGQQTWEFVDCQGADAKDFYWRNVQPGFLRDDADELNHAVSNLLKVGRPRATFGLIRFELSAVPSKSVYQILSDATSSSEDFPANHMEGYAIKEAFKHLNERGEISVNDMASLEFRYLAVLEREEETIPNLERQINENPEMFAQAIAFVFRRSDENEDPKELQLEVEEFVKTRAEQAYRLLDRLSSIPGRDRDGLVSSDRLVSWIKSVRKFLKDWARSEVGDSQIGQLLAKAPVGEDGVWPCEPVRDAMEETLNNDIASGFRIGKYNLRGVHVRGEGGNQERELAAQYDGWADALSHSHPRVAKVLRDIRDGYLADGESQDTDARIRRRLRH